MARTELHNMFGAAKSEGLDADLGAMTCIVRTTATDATDDVEVTLPNSASPHLRVEVNWRPTVQVVGGAVEPRYPEEDDEGIVIEADTGELWLIW